MGDRAEREGAARAWRLHVSWGPVGEASNKPTRDAKFGPRSRSTKVEWQLKPPSALPTNMNRPKEVGPVRGATVTESGHSSRLDLIKDL